MNKDINSTPCFIAKCHSHDWEGMRRETREEAQADLDAHKATYPDEIHISTVEQC